MFENNDRTELSELGEFGLIDRIAKSAVPNQKSSIKGIGDDAAVLGTGKKKTLITTDLLLEGIHFDLSYAPLKHLGYKAVAVKPRETQLCLHFSTHFKHLYLLTEALHRDAPGNPKIPSRSLTNLCQNSISDGPKYRWSLRKLTSN